MMASFRSELSPYSDSVVEYLKEVERIKEFIEDKYKNREDSATAKCLK